MVSICPGWGSLSTMIFVNLGKHGADVSVQRQSGVNTMIAQIFAFFGRPKGVSWRWYLRGFAFHSFRKGFLGSIRDALCHRLGLSTKRRYVLFQRGVWIINHHHRAYFCCGGCRCDCVVRSGRAGFMSISDRLNQKQHLKGKALGNKFVNRCHMGRK